MTWLATFILSFLTFCVAFAIWVRVTPAPKEPPPSQDWFDMGRDR